MNPVLKWVGGKRQLLPKIVELMPKEYNRYYEPFVGGGALLFEVLPKVAVINDMNSELINLYEVLSNDKDYKEFIQYLDLHELNHSKEYYYEIREMDRDDNFSQLSKAIRAARVVYLNKAGFNGLYRVNSKGYFNVPFGKKDKVSIYSKDNLESVHEYLSNNKIDIRNIDFEASVNDAKENDFVYFDPPYDPWEEKNSFTSYTQFDFTKEDQVRLFNVFKALDKKGVKVMLSNHYTDFIKDLYKDYRITVVPAKRLVNSKSSGRGDVLEVLITNYE
ncbi:Site-specific DNA methylase [Alteracholeplasma palmae J233]|uniref:Site-specific DNA-methyltransferase (adenine-specific) n=1 Tax=Alteracholeplasma palmae (strain ATCC 49389 / J233) TaxID=1318466 RepID=U4KJM3_ALTPJ|nr:DNA adenine methylase [Alteracholeplasma palmae]CCV63607.1 Site-specific DNA methylase [Alteracholeplasma palmae J233]